MDNITVKYEVRMVGDTSTPAYTAESYINLNEKEARSIVKWLAKTAQYGNLNVKVTVEVNGDSWKGAEIIEEEALGSAEIVLDYKGSRLLRRYNIAE